MEPTEKSPNREPDHRHRKPGMVEFVLTWAFMVGVDLLALWALSTLIIRAWNWALR